MSYIKDVYGVPAAPSALNRLNVLTAGAQAFLMLWPHYRNSAKICFVATIVAKQFVLM
jgi:hypothetical protein